MNKDLETVLFDVDGVIADNKEYKEWLDHNGMFNPSKFLKSVPNIKPLAWGVNLANSMYVSNYNVVLVTARSGTCREETKNWLRKNKVMYHKLHTNDEDKDFHEIAEYKMNIANQYNVMLVVEDKPETVDAYRANGYTCLQPNHLYETKDDI